MASLQILQIRREGWFSGFLFLSIVQQALVRILSEQRNCNLSWIVKDAILDSQEEESNKADIEKYSEMSP